MVSAPMFENYNSSTDNWAVVHTNASKKVLGAVLLQKYTAAKHFHSIESYSKKFNNIQ